MPGDGLTAGAFALAQRARRGGVALYEPPIYGGAGASAKTLWRAWVWGPISTTVNLTATLTTAPAMTVGIGKVLSAAMATAPSFTKAVGVNLAAACSTAASLSVGVAISLAASLSSAASIIATFVSGGGGGATAHEIFMRLTGKARRMELHGQDQPRLSGRKRNGDVSGTPD